MYLSTRGRWIFAGLVIGLGVMCLGFPLVFDVFGPAVSETVYLGVLIAGPVVLVVLLWLDRRPGT